MPTNNAPLILSNSQVGITRMLPYDPEGGLTLEDWRPTGLYEMTLTPDAVRALVRALPPGLLEEAMGLADAEPRPLHWERPPGRAACGSEAAFQRVTPAPQDITCPVCLEEWHAVCHAGSLDNQTLAALREAE